MLLLFVYPNLVSSMRKRDLDYKDLADILGISEYAAYRRLRGFTGWKLDEAICLCQYFGASDAAWLFHSGDTVTQKF
jgi:plasmid maintenance system antidote protein VapI